MKRTFLGKLWRLMFVKLPLAFFALTFLWVLILKWCPVYVTPLMIQRSIEYRGDKGFHTRKTWTPYEKISPEMARAVIASACSQTLLARICVTSIMASTGRLSVRRKRNMKAASVAGVAAQSPNRPPRMSSCCPVNP